MLKLLTAIGLAGFLTVAGLAYSGSPCCGPGSACCYPGSPCCDGSCCPDGGCCGPNAACRDQK